MSKVLQIHERDSRYFADASGRTFIPIGCNLCFVRGANCGIAMGKLLSETAKACGGKGGGRPDFAQGSAADAKEAAAYAVERITKAD